MNLHSCVRNVARIGCVSLALWAHVQTSLLLAQPAALPTAPIASDEGEVATGQPESQQAGAPASSTIQEADRNFFEQQVRPLLVTHCLECHSTGENQPEGGLALDSRAGWQRGGELGPPIISGRPDDSLLIEAVEQKGDRLRMPPDGRLSAAEISVLREWILRGAPDPRQDAVGETDQKSAALAWASEPNMGRDFWAFQPIQRVVPDASVAQYFSLSSRSEIDLFVMMPWRVQGLLPAPTADRQTLLRRVTLDLTGLPPTPEEVRSFLRDDRPDAYEQLVDRLLASPRYGQRWGRFWLDVARYADSNGLDENIAHGNAWRYRDYVIAAWNDDKPYDQFVMEQLAGDLYSDNASETRRAERQIATGFLVLGPKVLAEVDETKMEMDIIDEQVETVGRAFLGLTLGCARCHDHKFDPIRIQDYYALAGIFKSTRTMEHFKKIARWNEVSVASPRQHADYASAQASLLEQQERLKLLMSQLAADNSSSTGSEDDNRTDEGRSDLRQKVDSLKESIATTQQAMIELPFAMAVAEQPEPVSLAVHIRGNHLTLGDVVPRQVPEVLRNDAFPSPQMPLNQSGRWQLAEWVVDSRNPLTARVLANRVWRWHFGRGLVESTDNFGRLGGRPTHPELLDWLAAELIRHNWSIKKLQRAIVLSETYRRGSGAKELQRANEAIDPENRFLWQSNLRRMEAEAIRDSLLAVSGLLDESMGGSLLHVKNREFLFDHTSKDETRYDIPRRSVYLPVIRNHLYEVFQLFDYVDDSVTNSDRSTTTVATQALFLMNGDLVREAARATATRIFSQESTGEARHEAAYWTIFGRAPTLEERRRDLQYLELLRRQLLPASQETAAENSQQRDAAEFGAWTLLCQAWLASNEFIYVR